MKRFVDKTICRWNVVRRTEWHRYNYQFYFRSTGGIDCSCTLEHRNHFVKNMHELLVDKQTTLLRIRLAFALNPVGECRSLIVFEQKVMDWRPSCGKSFARTARRLTLTYGHDRDTTTFGFALTLLTCRPPTWPTLVPTNTTEGAKAGEFFHCRNTAISTQICLWCVKYISRIDFESGLIHIYNVWSNEVSIRTYALLWNAHSNADMG